MRGSRFCSNDAASEYRARFNDAHVKAVDAYQTLPFAGVGSLPIASIPGCPGPDFDGNDLVPGLGEHTSQILSSLGRTEAEIASLYSARVLS